MKKWDSNKLEEMNNSKNEYTNIQLNYRWIAENYEDIVLTLYNNSDLIPLMFDDVKIAYPGNPLDDVDLSSIDGDLKQIIQDKQRERKTVHIKHFSRNMSHEAWFNFLEGEVKDFVDKYPQFGDVLL